MSTKTPNKGVPGVPLGALDAITDENTRLVLRSIVDGWHVRNGAAGDGTNAFITKAELGQFQQNIPGFGLGSGMGSARAQRPTDPNVLTAGEINRIINDLQAQVMESVLFKELGERIERIDTTGLANGNTIRQEIIDRSNADNAIYTSTNSQFSVINGNVGAIQAAQTTMANNVAALATQTNTLQSSVGQNTIALQQEATTRINADNDIYAKYSVKIDNNGYVSGFGLMSTANNSVPFSDFLVRADRFAIASPSGPGITPTVPFIVLTTTDSKGNRPGVYMDSVMIKNAAIGTAQIDDLSVNTLKIAGNAVTLPFSASFGIVANGQAVGTSAQYLVAGSKLLVIATYTVALNGFHAANIQIGVEQSGGGRVIIASNGFSFENYGNGVISGSYIVPHDGWWAVGAIPNVPDGGTCTSLTINAMGAQR